MLERAAVDVDQGGVLGGSTSSAVARMDSTGVIPEPAATAT